MITIKPQSDSNLQSRLNHLTDYDRDYWSFKGNSYRDHGHGFFQYPAMMVPQMVRTILNEMCAVHPEIKWVGDPFAGSGTILTESMLRGLNFVGQDINPLAVLLCKSKAGPFFISVLNEKITELNYRIASDRKKRIEVHFSGRDKWFREDVLIALSKIQRAILAERSIWARRFFWIGFAEAVRLTSNSRTSTFKLHTRTSEDIVRRQLNPIGIFYRTLIRNLEHLRTQADFLQKNEMFEGGHYKGQIKISLGDARCNRLNSPNKCDVIITSPPYGDNATTVPYGQYSYLPLQWIKMSDIDRSADAGFLSSTHEIDYRSLGGSRRIEQEHLQSLCDRSASFKRFITRINKQPQDREKRVTSFFRDLDTCINPILDVLHPGGLMVWILGNRKVGGIRVPLDKVLNELLDTHHVSVLATLKRHISSKRMALKNNIANLMSSETILVMRKAALHGN